jgi:hypothetical protein
VKIYYFTSEEHGLDNLAKSRLKISRINSLNDPYEFYVNLEDRNGSISESYLEDLKKHNHSLLGMVCFNKNWGHPVHWSHYGDSHKGICLCFEIDKKYLIKIKYRKHPLVVTPEKFELNFPESTTSKYRAWKYEKEHRLHIDLSKTEGYVEECVDGVDLQFVNFSDVLKLKKVILGCKSTLSEDDIMNIKEQYADIEVVTTKQSRLYYRITEDEVY